MALKSLTLETVRKMDKICRTNYFEKFAGYFPDSPSLCYAIRVGSTTLFSADTADLRKKFNHLLRYGKVRKTA